MNDIKDILKEQFYYVDSLREDIVEVVRDYTGNEYENINRKLRNSEKLNKKEEAMINILDQTINGSPSTTGTITVYRGIKFEKFNSNMISYLSTTYDIDIAYTHSNKNCCILKIVVPSGSKLLPIERISEYSSEKEILLSRYCKLNITDYHYEGDMLFYDVVYLPSVSIEINKNTDKNNVKNSLSSEEWSERLVKLFTIEELEIYDTIEDVINSYVDLYFSKANVPKEGIKIAIDRLKSMYD